MQSIHINNSSSVIFDVRPTWYIAYTHGYMATTTTRNKKFKFEFNAFTFIFFLFFVVLFCFIYTMYIRMFFFVHSSCRYSVCDFPGNLMSSHLNNAQ